MATDITSFVEVRKKEAGLNSSSNWEKVGMIFSLTEEELEYGQEQEQETKTDQPFRERNYSLFAFLGNVRNYDFVRHIGERGLPLDVSNEIKDLYEKEKWYFSPHHVCLNDLLKFDYDKSRYTGKKIKSPNNSYRTFLPEFFFKRLEEIQSLFKEEEEVRIIFWFDN